MWNQIVATLVILILATYLIQLFVPRAHTTRTRRINARWDVSPVLAFLALLLLAFAFTESLQRAHLEIWLLGLAGGVGLGVIVWIFLGARTDLMPARNVSALRATLRVIRVFGPPILIAVLLFALAARVLGSIVEVFGAAFAGALALAMAVWLFWVSGK